MSASETPRLHPYSDYAGSPEWSSIDRALLELAKNRDLVETTAHEYIVGYLCEALANRSNGKPLATDIQQCGGHDRRLAALRRIQEAVRAANAGNRDLVQELIDERRAEAQID